MCLPSCSCLAGWLAVGDPDNRIGQTRRRRPLNAEMSHATHARWIRFCLSVADVANGENRKLFSLLINMNFFQCVIYDATSFICEREMATQETILSQSFPFWFSNHESRAQISNFGTDLRNMNKSVDGQLFDKMFFFHAVIEVIEVNTLWEVKVIHLKCLNSTFWSIEAVPTLVSQSELYFFFSRNYNKNS